MISNNGGISRAAQADAEAGTSDSAWMSPLAVAQAITALSADPLTTGDVKLTYKTTADTGYVMADDGSIGSATSGASNRANADTEALYTLLYDNMSDAECPVETGRGANAAADFAANKALTIPLTMGRSLGVAGSGASLTARTLGDTVGEETHVQSEAELATHNHTIAMVNTGSKITAGPGTVIFSGSSTTGNKGSSTAFNVVQPTSFINIMVKL